MSLLVRLAAAAAIDDSLSSDRSVGLAAAAAIDALSAINSKRVLCAVVVTAREYPGHLLASTAMAFAAIVVVVVIAGVLLASTVMRLETESVAVDGVVVASSAAAHGAPHLSHSVLSSLMNTLISTVRLGHILMNSMRIRAVGLGELVIVTKACF